MFKSYVISIDVKPKESECSDHDFRSVKYKLRREYVTQKLIPSFAPISDIEIFNAIVPTEFRFEGESVIYGEISFKRGKDRNNNKECSVFQTSLSIGFWHLYRKSAESGSPILIFEDDAMVPESSMDTIRRAIDSFLKIEGPAMLYLQSQCPWKEGLPIRKFREGMLIDRGEELNQIEKSFSDIAGTTCFMINAEGSRKMIELIEEVGLGAADQLTNRAMNEQRIAVYIPKDNENMAFINKDLQ